MRVSPRGKGLARQPLTHKNALASAQPRRLELTNKRRSGNVSVHCPVCLFTALSVCPAVCSRSCTRNASTPTLRISSRSSPISSDGGGPPVISHAKTFFANKAPRELRRSPPNVRIIYVSINCFCSIRGSRAPVLVTALFAFRYCLLRT